MLRRLINDGPVLQKKSANEKSENLNDPRATGLHLEVGELEVEGHVGYQHQPDGLDEYSHCKPNQGLIFAKLW